MLESDWLTSKKRMAKVVPGWS